MGKGLWDGERREVRQPHEKKKGICVKGKENRRKKKKDIIRNKPKNTIRGETTYREKGKKPIPRGKNTITGKVYERPSTERKPKEPRGQISEGYRIIEYLL